MDAVLIGLVGLGGLYTIANQKEKEGYQNKKLQNTNLHPENFPIEKNNLSLNVKKYDNANQGTDKYFNENTLKIKNEQNSDTTLPSSEFKSLTGDRIDTDNFKHNNMMPYFGSKIKGRGGPEQQESVLDSMVGRGSTNISKEEIAPLFKPHENMQWAHGVPNNSDFFQQRQNTSMSMNNIKPFQTENVGPGLNQGYGVNGSNGFNSGMESRNSWLPYTVDELRVKTNPKVTFGLKGLEGPAQQVVKNRGIEGKVEKNLPDTYYINGPDRYFTTTGVEKAQTRQAIQTMGNVNRATTSASYQGIPDGPNANVAPQNWNSLAKNEHVYTDKTGPMSVTNQGATDNDYNIKGYNLPVNNRQTTRQTTHFKPVSGIVNAIVAPVMDVLRPSRKENVIGNIRSNGNVQQLVSGEYVLNPGDKTRTTIKEMTLGKGNDFNIQGQGGGAYNISEQQAITNQRDSTNTTEINGGGAPYGKRQQDLYFKNQRNNNNKLQNPYTPSGVSSKFNNNVNVRTWTERGKYTEQFIGGPSMSISGPNIDTYGKLNTSQYDNQSINCDRIEPNILDAFKKNPYTHSLHSHA
jgi:hypothetical protein|tara:strand:+ start:4026 stop:5753 length:1728 start_codon:yes stop_codon:yes gene_type:complete